jgi:hypothetical protein
MLCKMSVNELYCSADSFEILGMFFQPIFLSRRIGFRYHYAICVCVRLCVALSIVKLFNRLSRNLYCNNNENVFDREAVPTDFLLSVIATWRTREFVKRERP